MKIGFTGSRLGMSQCQKEQFVLELLAFDLTEFHHGDCSGADAEAHDIVAEFFPACKIIVHPPESNYLRAFKPGHEFREPAGYIRRDKNIVDATDQLIGAPLTDVEQIRSGSWTTIRYARRIARPVTVLAR